MQSFIIRTDGGRNNFVAYSNAARIVTRSKIYVQTLLLVQYTRVLHVPRDIDVCVTTNTPVPHAGTISLRKYTNAGGVVCQILHTTVCNM